MKDHTNMSYLEENAKYQPSAKRMKTEPQPNHILLMTVLNPVYTITTDVIHTISSPYGQVLRIVIFKKNGVQALVEFESIDTAKRAKEALQGADIYSGCCTLRIEFAKPSKLNVYKNDTESWDYTNPSLGRERDTSDSRRPALLPDPRYPPAGPGSSFREGSRAPGGYPGEHHNGGPYGGGGGANNAGGGGGGYNNSYGRHNNPYESIYSRYIRGEDSYDGMGRGGPHQDMGYSLLSGGGTMGTGMLPPPQNIPQGSPVVMVYGMNHEKMNCDKVFNLFCLYGNVVKVKFLKSKEGCAMVQMGDTVSADRVIQNLRNSTFFGKTLSLAFSKQAYLSDVMQPYNLPDSTPSYKEYMGNKHNRFLNPDSAAKCRITPPSKVLHFYNCPTSMTDDDLKLLFLDANVTAPSCIKIFNTKSDRSSSGLIEFGTISEALEALVTVNHTPVPTPTSQYPYITKLCFSSTRQGIRQE